MHGNIVPLIVALLIWGALFLYLWHLDGRVREIQRELDDRAEGQGPAGGRSEEP